MKKRLKTSLKLFVVEEDFSSNVNLATADGYNAVKQSNRKIVMAAVKEEYIKDPITGAWVRK